MLSSGRIKVRHQGHKHWSAHLQRLQGEGIDWGWILSTNGLQVPLLLSHGVLETGRPAFNLLFWLCVNVSNETNCFVLVLRCNSWVIADRMHNITIKQFSLTCRKSHLKRLASYWWQTPLECHSNEDALKGNKPIPLTHGVSIRRGFQSL